MVGKRVSLPGRLQANTDVFKFVETHPKIPKYKSCSAILNVRGKWQNVTRYFAISSSLTIFENTFTVFPLAFSLLNSPV